MTQLSGNAELADIDLAVKLVERHNIQDLATPGLLELTAVSQHGMTTASGLNDYDYENICNLTLGHKELQQVQTVNKIPIPAVVLEHFRSLTCHIEMGLFPEIGRAWLTIDSELYIWTYEPARDVAFYDGLNQVIVGVGLIKPRPNVFIKEVQYLLVLTTALEIAILGVKFGSNTKTLCSPTRNGGGVNGVNNGSQNTTIFEELQLVDRPIFILGTDDVNFRVIEGTEDGRIFLGGHDGCLYEIAYQADAGWFGKPCKKINHSKGLISQYVLPKLMKAFVDQDPIVQIAIDNSRHLLYTLSERGAIEAWLIGEKSGDVRRIARISEDDLAKRACGIISTVDQAVFKELKSICALTTQDSNQVHLIAVTQSGVRFYFSTISLYAAANGYNNQQQQRFQQPQRQQQHQLADSSFFTGVPPNVCVGDQTTLTTNPSSTAGAATTEKFTPTNLYLLHVRLPPGYTTHIGVHKPKLVHSALYSDGTLLLVSTTAQRDQGTLLSLSSLPFPNRQCLTESATLMPLDGLVWSMSPMRERCHHNSQLRSLIYQTRNPRKVMLLTNQGIHVVALLKPADILRQLLVACHGAHHEAVKNFFQVQTPREACYACLLIICNEQFRNTDLSMWAAQALMLYGGEPTYQSSNAAGGGMFGQQQMQTPGGGGRNYFNTSFERPSTAPFAVSTPFSSGNSPPAAMSSPLSNILQQQQQQQYQQQAFSPISQQQSNNANLPPMMMMMGTTVMGSNSQQLQNLNFSYKHEALYLYVARLLRPIWHLNCINPKDLTSTLTSNDCANILDELHAIRAVLDGNAINELSFSSTASLHTNQTFMSAHGGYGHAMYATSNLTNNNNQQDQRRVIEQAHNEEKRSLIGLNNFIKHTCEVIGLWKILCDHEMCLIVNQLTREQQESLCACTFHDLIISTDTCAILIVTLINSYLNDNASVGSISTKLRDICPTLYRHEDAVTYKAAELLRNSASCLNAEERLECCLTALQLCKDAAPNLPLQHICQQFMQVGFYEGVIELSATCASKTDPEQYGIHYYNKDEPNDDRDGYASYAARMLCYKEVRSMLDHIYQETAAAQNGNEQQQTIYTSMRDATFYSTATNSFASTDAAAQRGGGSGQTTRDANAQIMRIVSLGIQINDPLLHVTLYEWLLSHEMLSELLGLTEPSLGEFLRRNVVRNPDNLQLVDLLWKYYEKNDQHAQAAQILDNLASAKSQTIALEQRLEYLARAVMCMRNESVGCSSSNGILVKELEDKLEIARVQKRVLDAMNELLAIGGGGAANSNVANAVAELNFMLYDNTQLYQNFAEPFNLWECKLAIFNCSHHNDTLLIESVWSQIINKACEGSTSSSTTYERCNRLFTKIEALIREFGETGHCFPLSFIIRELEVKACHLRFPEGIVPEKLVAMNLDIELLMEYYAKMISNNERIWANEGNEWHLVQSSICLVNLLTKNVQTIWHRSKRRVFGKAQDIVSTCLNLCYPKPGTEQLQHTLKELQVRLQRALT